ncbi:MAG TPA: ABC transporter permease [Candidatus Kapabacteria bacterium]|jgi:putative ABC transport system permease protein|nr:ABC transporter permease [Candidatus Kapabacteria bacterium]
MNIGESVRIALGSIRTNKLRAGLTLLSISIGVFAIVGVGAAVSALDSTLDDQLESLGRNTFYIQRDPMMDFGDPRRWRNRQPISLRQGLMLKERLTGATDVGLTNFTSGVVLRAGSEKTDPDVTIYGTDETFVPNFTYDIAAGRSIDPQDVQLGSDVVVLGADVADELFRQVNPVGRTIAIRDHRYLVIGVMEPKGASFGQSQDNIVAIPITSAAKYFFDERGTSLMIMVRTPTVEDVPAVMDQATGLMRVIRRVDFSEPNDFEIESNESIGDSFGALTKYVRWFGLVCGGIALFAAGIGIMNIMLVSVKERTREIGIRKAIGATRANILTQFMIEAVTLCQLGALIGIGLGVLGGIAMSAVMGSSASLPWTTIAISVGLCLLIGLVFGIYPAWRAAKLDPIEALRYE